MKLGKWGVLLSAIALTFSVASAHVSNENTIYDDTQNSNAKEELVYLRTLGVIPYTSEANVYLPQDLLTKKDLGYWAAQFPVNDETKDKEYYVNEALKNQLIDSKDGNATYQDVIVAFFGKDSLKDEDIQTAIKGKETETLTREEFAEFLGKFIKRENGQGLFAKAGMEQGPVGKIGSVVSKKIKQNDSTFEVYNLTINGKKAAISEHPKAMHGSVELEDWKGKTLDQTWVKDGEIVLLELKKGEMDMNVPANTNHSHGDSESKATFPWVLTGGIVIALLLLFAVFKSRKR